MGKPRQISINRMSKRNLAKYIEETLTTLVWDLSEVQLLPDVHSKDELLSAAKAVQLLNANVRILFDKYEDEEKETT